MAQTFRENAHLRTNQEKFNEGWDRIFGKKEKEHICLICNKEVHKEELDGICCQECIKKGEECD